MNTVFALFFVFIMQDGSTNPEWVATYTSQQECEAKAKKIMADTAKKWDKVPGRGGINQIIAGCYQQRGA